MRPVFALLNAYHLFFLTLALLIGWWLVMRIRRAAGIWRLRFYAFPRPWLKYLHSDVPHYTRLPWELRAPYQDKVLQFIDAKRFIPCGDLSEVTESARVILGGHAALLLLNQAQGNYPEILTVQLYPHGDPNADGGARSSSVALWWDAEKRQATDPRDARSPMADIARELGAKALPSPLLLTGWARIRYAEFAATSPGVIPASVKGEPEDIFAVATELFLAAPAVLKQQQPGFYNALRHFYLVDPDRWSLKQ